MSKFMCVHSIPPNAVTAQQVNGFAQASQNDPDVQGYRSFINLSEGKIVCILEAADKEAVAAWLNKMGLPAESINQVEMEGYRGTIEQQTPAHVWA